MDMKKITFLLFLTIISLVGVRCQEYVTIKTPTNVSVEAIDVPEAGDASLATWEAESAAWILNHHSDAVRIGPASHTYNCHNYAWHSSDGGSIVWINKNNQNNNPNVAKYWSNPSPTYTATDIANATKIFLPNGDHSLIKSKTSPDWYESKWGNWPLYTHSLYSHPYNTSGMQFYKLNITGESFVCYPATRTYTTLNITGSPTYVWTADKFTITGSTYTATAIANGGNGQGYIKVAITSPHSNTTISGKTLVWVGPPQITNQKVDGSNYSPGMQICPGNHYLLATPIGGNASTATWTVPPGIIYYVGNNQLDFTFPSSLSSIAISTRSSNSCGAGSNYYFYLSKKSYGCSMSLAMNMYPNPASDVININILEDTPIVAFDDPELNNIIVQDNKGYESNNYSIKIYNSQSMLLLDILRSGKSFEVPIKNLNEGIYLVEVSDGKSVSRQQLIVRH